MFSFLETLSEHVSTKSIFSADSEQVERCYREAKIVESVKASATHCTKCDGLLERSLEDNIMVCSGCNLVTERVNTDDAISREGNIDANAIVTVDPKCAQEKKTRDDFYEKLRHNTIGIDNPTIEEAVATYLRIQQYHIRRGKVRTSIMAACVQKICESKNMYYKPREIAEIFRISCSDLADGNKQVNNFISSGIITINQLDIVTVKGISIDSIEERKAYLIINKYLRQLDLYDEAVLLVVFKTVKFLIKYHMFTKSVTNTKCVGTLYVVLNQKNSRVDKQTIVEKLKIASNTFTNFAKKLVNFLQPSMIYNIYERKKCSRLRHLWEKNGFVIPERAPKN